MKNAITKFDDKHFFLSNFYEQRLWFKGYWFESAEAAYQSQKDPSRVKEFTHLPPQDAKNLGRKVNIREDWEEVKETIMEVIVREKFQQNKYLAEKLIAIGDKTLVEGNYWKDTYWGVCENVGQNKLGKILMKIRKELQLTGMYNKESKTIMLETEDYSINELFDIAKSINRMAFWKDIDVIIVAYDGKDPNYVSNKEIKEIKLTTDEIGNTRTIEIKNELSDLIKEAELDFKLIL